MKKFKILLGLFVCTFMIMPFTGVKAVGPDGIGYDGSNVTSKSENGVYYLTLTGDAVQDLEIASGEVVVLDLNGHNFTNFCTSCSAIYVKTGGKLTITDSGNSGVISKKNETNANVSVVNNEGTLTIEGGKISGKGNGSAALLNSGNLTITGGTITTEEDNVFGLVNKGTALINGGNFIQAHNFSVINNANEMEITNGNFKAGENNTSAYSLITNEGSNGKANLKVSGGTFNANNGVFYNQGNDVVTVSGGSFSQQDVSKYLPDGYTMTQDENGNYTVAKSETTPSEDNTKAEAKDVAGEITNPKTADSIILVTLTLLLSGIVAVVAGRKIVKAKM